MEVKQQQQGSAAALLLLIVALLASSARASDCWAIETDLKYHIPLGVQGTNGGCFKGVTVDENNCDVRTGGSTRTERIFSSLAACCEALEPQLKRDPRNGQPRTDQANAKSVCLTYKKAPAATTPATPAASAGAPARLIAAPAAAGREPNVCYAIETDNKSFTPMGVYGTFGGCIKGRERIMMASADYCIPDTKLDGTHAKRVFGSLAACCEAMEAQLQTDPRDGQPRANQANAKAVCLTYKKDPAVAQKSQQQPAAAGGRKLQDASVCYAVETDYKYNIPMGVYGTFGGCVKGTLRTLEDSRSYCNTDVRLDATRSEGNYGSLAACCDALEPRLQVNPRNGQPRKDQVNGKAVCLSYKKTPPVVYGQPVPARKYLMFKAQDLPAEFDIPSSGSSYTKVCGGLDAVAKACSKEGDSCGAFTFGGDKDCGYLKYRYYGDSYPGPPPLKFTGNNKGWSTYVHEGIVAKAQGGSLDCADAKNAGVTLCQIKAVLPPILSSLNA